MSLCGWKNYLTYRFSRSTASIVGTALVTTPLRWRTCTASCVAETPGGLDIENLAGHAAEPPASCCISSIADIVARQDRSEEHTSELQSLMRNSYAVLCLKKKK